MYPLVVRGLKPRCKFLRRSSFERSGLLFQIKTALDFSKVLVANKFKGKMDVPSFLLSCLNFVV